MTIIGTIPVMGNNISDDIPKIKTNFTDLLTEVETTGQMKLGSARAYYADYSAGLPTPAAASDAGRIAYNSEANYGGQVYIHSGSAWVPLYSSKTYKISDTGANVCASGAAWTQYDPQLTLSPYLLTAASGWAYEINYCLNIVASAATILEIRLRDTTNGADIDYWTLLIPGGDGDFERCVQRTIYYEHAAKGQITIEPQAYTTVATTCSRSAAGGGGGTPTDYLIIREIVKKI